MDCHHQRRVDRVVRNEIGRLDIDFLFRPADQPHIIVPDRLQQRIRPAVNDLHIAAVPVSGTDALHVLRIRKQILPRRIVPIQQKTQLQTHDRLAADAQVRIPPVPESGIQTDIFLSDIEAAHIGNPVVDHHDLPVVAVIDTQMEPAQQCREELGGLDSLSIQLLPVALAHGAAAHGVKQDAHLHALRRLLCQHIFDTVEQHIVFDNVVLNMNKFLRLMDILDQRIELGVSVHKDVNVVGIGQHRAHRVQIEHDKIGIILNVRRVLLQLLAL